MKYIIIFIILIMVFCGCSSDYVAEIESDTEWSGAFSDRTVDGYGNDEVILHGDNIVCCVVQKQTRGGYLRVRIRIEDTFFWFDNTTEWEETKAEYGVVSACNR